MISPTFFYFWFCSFKVVLIRTSEKFYVKIKVEAMQLSKYIIRLDTKIKQLTLSTGWSPFL